MTKVLFIKGNPKKTEQSYSLRLGQAYVEAYKAAHADAEVTELDLYEDHIPLIDEEVMTGWGKLAQQQDLNNHEAHKVTRLGELVDQFVAADVVVLAAPMWNFSYPPMVKAYVDAVSVAGKTFKYTAEGPVGLAGGKKVVLAESRGGVYSEGPAAGVQHTESYMKAVLGWMGITDVDVFLVEGVAIDPSKGEEILAAAVAKAEQAAKN
ncbi:FMN-dependent NADH-azoreductase [Deinococcus sp. UYEF24]